jgi:hypothetical protein
VVGVMAVVVMGDCDVNSSDRAVWIGLKDCRLFGFGILVPLARCRPRPATSSVCVSPRIRPHALTSSTYAATPTSALLRRPPKGTEAVELYKF